jgi:hypothetical protein
MLPRGMGMGMLSTGVEPNSCIRIKVRRRQRTTHTIIITSGRSHALVRRRGVDDISLKRRNSLMEGSEVEDMGSVVKECKVQ